MDGEYTVRPYYSLSYEGKLLESITENTETTETTLADVKEAIAVQIQAEQACAGAEIFLLAALFGAICARGLFKW
jgi:hypothetical protein